MPYTRQPGGGRGPTWVSGARLTCGARIRLAVVSSAASSASSTKEPPRRASSTGGIESAPRIWPESALLLSGMGSGKLGWKLRRLGRLGPSSSSWTLSRATLWALQGLWRRIVTPERAERSRTGTGRWQVYADLAGARCSSSMQERIRDGRRIRPILCSPKGPEQVSVGHRGGHRGREAIRKCDQVIREDPAGAVVVRAWPGHRNIGRVSK